MSSVKNNHREEKKKTRTNYAFFKNRHGLYRPVMQECEGCWVSTWYTALRPGEGLQSPLGCHNTAQLRQAGGSASSERSAGNMIIKRTWFAFFLVPVRLFDNLVCVCVFCFVFFICEEDIPEDAGVGSLQPGHKPSSSAAAPCEARSSQSTTVRCRKKQNKQR